MSDVVIKVDNIFKSYKMYNSPHDRLKEALSIRKRKYHKDFYAVNDVSLSIKKGETVGLIGKNGSGKSTLLKIITGLTTPNQGNVSIDGSISALLELGAGFNPEFTGVENIYLNGSIKGIPKEVIEAKKEDIIRFADIGDFINQPVKSYSSGMFARLAFSVAVNFEQEILLVDEVLAVGDMAFQLKCMDKMKEIKKNGVTIIFVSHDIYSIKNFCDRVVWMKDGKIEAEGDTHIITQAYEDYMKLGNLSEALEIKKNSEVGTKESLSEITNIENNVDLNDILTINKVYPINHKGEKDCDLYSGEDFTISVEYTLRGDFPGIVGGVAIFDNEHNYVCGLNTKLDNFIIPREPGVYTLYIKYPKCNLLSGTYFLDVGFMESSAIKILDYKAKDYQIKIIESEYKAEGIFNLEHQWGVIKR